MRTCGDLDDSFAASCMVCRLGFEIEIVIKYPPADVLWVETNGSVSIENISKNKNKNKNKIKKKMSSFFHGSAQLEIPGPP